MNFLEKFELNFYSKIFVLIIIFILIGNGINFQLEIDNLNEIYTNFKNSNYKITFDIEENWYRQDNKLLGNKEFLIQDPDGYLLRFSEDLGEKEV